MDKDIGKLTWCYALCTWIKKDILLCKSCDLCEKRMQQHKEVERLLFGDDENGQK